MENIKAWSYTRYAVFKTCPFKAKLQYIDGCKEPANSAMDRGSGIHADIEAYLKDDTDRLSDNVKGCRKELMLVKALEECNVHVEDCWAVDAELKPVDWYAPEAWCRAKVDCWYQPAAQTIVIIDHKTGKRRQEHIMQADLYAAMAKWMMPATRKITVKFFYVDNDEVNEFDYDSKGIQDACDEWQKRGQHMCQQTEFPQKPSNNCRFCHFSARSAGLCPHGE